MKTRYALFGFCFAVMAATMVWAADVSGKWTAQVPGREGAMQEQTFTFKVEGTKLTGTVSGQQGETAIADGKVSGDEISFTVTRERQGNTFKQLYKGKVAGNEIKFTRTTEGGQGNRPPVEFVAKRAK